MAEVSAEFGLTIDSLRERSDSAARKAVAQLSSDESGVTFTAIGEWLNVTDAAAAHLARRSRALEQEDGAYRGKLSAIRTRLTVG